MTSNIPTRIGIAGTGAMSRSVAKVLSRHHPDLRVTRVLTRRPIDSVTNFPLSGVLTNSLNELIDQSELIVECTGETGYATDVIEGAFEAGRSAITMNVQMHVTTGSYLASKGYLSEAEGDQPGSLAALHEEAVQMGFKPLVYGNMKGFLNTNPTLQEMEFWAERQGISVTQTTGATDGTKLQMEQVLIGNHCGATIVKQGLEGPLTDDLAQASSDLAAIAERIGQPIADYVLAKNMSSAGIFVACRHDDDFRELLAYYKMGQGPYYVLSRPYHLCSLEVVKTIRRALSGTPPLLTNSPRPALSVGAVAKRVLDPGECIDKGVGGMALRGEALKISEAPNHVPIGVTDGAVMRRRVEPDQLVCRDDVEIQDTRANRIALGIIDAAARRAACESC
jgi:predicted homoserine dehydrogenase-like protein